MTKRLCTISARGGSKGVKNKNIRLLCGKPLIAHTILQAKASGLFEAVAINSDSDDILNTAGQWGADLLLKRPAELAGDTAAKIPAIQWGVQEAEARLGMTFDTLVDLDATSPLRSVSDIQGSVALLEEQQATNVITAAPARRSPYFNMVEVSSEGVARLSKPLPQATVRRQDAPACYDMNASIYVWTRESLFGPPVLFQERTLLFVMPEERSFDIDTELDFELVAFLMERAQTQP